MLQNKIKHVLQPKLTIGQSNDQYEQEADAMADQAMHMPKAPPPIQRKCEDCEEEQLQMKPFDTHSGLFAVAQEQRAKKELQIQAIGEEDLIQRKFSNNEPDEPTTGDPPKSESSQKAKGEESSSELLSNLNKHDAKAKKIAPEQQKLTREEKQKEEKFPKDKKKQLKRNLIEQIKIKEKIKEKSSQYTKLKKKEKKKREEGKEKKAEHKWNKADNLDFEILNYKLRFNKLNDEIKYIKGYSDEELRELEEKELKVPNIAKDYTFFEKEKKTKKKKKFDAKKTALKLVELNLDETVLKLPLTTADKKVILKYYAVRKDKEYDLYMLQRFIATHLQSPGEIKKIFGDLPNQIKPTTFIKLIEPGVTSTNTKKPKDERMGNYIKQYNNEKSRKNNKVSKLTQKAEEKTASNSQIKELQSLKEQGYTGEYTSKNVKEEYKSTIAEVRNIIKVLRGIQTDINTQNGVKGDKKTNQNVLGKTIKLTNPHEIQITQEQLEARDKFEESKFEVIANNSSETSQTENGSESENTNNQQKEYIEQIIEPYSDVLSKEIVTGLKEQFNFTPLFQTKLLPALDLYKGPIIASGIDGLIYLGSLYLGEEINKVKNNDFGSLGALMNFVPELKFMKGSFGNAYSLGSKDYSKGAYKGSLKFHQDKATPFLNEHLTNLMTDNGTGNMGASDWRKGYPNFLSPRLDLSIKDATKKSGKSWLSHDLSAFLDNRIFLQGNANLSPLQFLDQAVNNFDLEKILSALKNKDRNELLNETAQDRDKSTYDFKAGAKYAFGLGNQKLKLSGDYLSLNNFDKNEEIMHRVFLDLAYSNKLNFGPKHSLAMNAGGSMNFQDPENNFDLKKKEYKANLGANYSFGNSRKATTSISSSLNYTHANSYHSMTESMNPSDSWAFKASMGHKINPEYLSNTVFQFELKAEYTSNFEGINTFKLFLVIRPRN